MATTYTDAIDQVKPIAEELIAGHHREIGFTGVTITYLFAHAEVDDDGLPKGPALKAGGYPALAVVRKTSLKDRAAGMADVVMILDGDEWREWSDERKRAIIDHELAHIEVVMLSPNAAKRDDLGRPVIRIRRHDFQIGGFEDVCRRHKEHAVEAQAVAKVWTGCVQQTFPWG